jgi:hypothetical protein
MIEEIGKALLDKSVMNLDFPANNELHSHFIKNKCLVASSNQSSYY